MSTNFVIADARYEAFDPTNDFDMDNKTIQVGHVSGAGRGLLRVQLYEAIELCSDDEPVYSDNGNQHNIHTVGELRAFRDAHDGSKSDCKTNTLMPIRFSKYSDCMIAKYKNARVIVMPPIQRDNATVYGIIQFKVRTNNLTPKATHEDFKGKIVATTIGLSKEAIFSLHSLLGEYIKDYL